MSRQPTVGDALRIVAAIPLPARDREDVRRFVLTLPRNHNLPASAEQISGAQIVAGAAHTTHKGETQMTINTETTATPFSEWIAETIQDEITLDMDEMDLIVFASQAIEVAESNGDTILEDHAGIVAWLTGWLDAKRASA